jgi:hypothetical protein
MPDEVFSAPIVQRIHGVQTLRYEAQWTQAGARLESVLEEVHARDAAYVVLFQGRAGTGLTALADRAIATLDALPASTTPATTSTATWVIGGVIVAAILAALGFWGSRLKKLRGMDSRDLWPR